MRSIAIVCLFTLAMIRQVGAQESGARAQLEKVASAYRNVQTLKAQGFTTVESHSVDSDTTSKQAFTVLVGKGGRYREEFGHMLRVADGQTDWTYFPVNNTYHSYEERAAMPSIFEVAGMDARVPQRGLMDAKIRRQEQVHTLNGDVTCNVVEATYGSMQDARNAAGPVTFWIDVRSGLIWKTLQTREMPTRIGPSRIVQTVEFSVIEINATIDADLFKFTPPEGATEQGNGNVTHEKALIGHAAPDFKLRTLDGNEMELAALKGKIVIVDFWATWCGPCRMEIPKLEKLSKRFADRVVVLGVDAGEQEETVRSFARDNKMSYPVLLAKLDDRIFRQYSVNGFPTAVIIDGKGIVIDYELGAKTDSENLMKASIERISRPDYISPQPIPAAGEGVVGAAKAIDWPEPKSAAEFLERGAYSLHDKRYDNAIDDASAALKLKPGWDAALRLRAQANYDAKDYEAAIKDCSALLSRFPDWASVLQLRGLARSYSGHHDLAIPDYTEALKLNPYSGAFFNSRGWAYLEMGDLAKARQDLNRAIELSPELTRAYANRAKVFDKTGDLRSELADLDMFLRLSPKDSWAQGRRAEIQRELSSVGAKR